MGFIKVNDADGNAHVLEAVEGWRVMEVIREHGLPIAAVCGGACACATCHVHLAPAWAARVHAARDDEEAMLDAVPDVGPDLAAELPDHLGPPPRRSRTDAAGSLTPMRYFPLFADLDRRRRAGGRRRRAGRPEGAPAAARPVRASPSSPRRRRRELAGLAAQGRIWHHPDGDPFVRATSTASGWSTPPPAILPLDAAVSRAAQAQRHAGQRRRRAAALHLHHAGHRRPRSGHRRDRHRRRRARAGARDQDAARAVAARQPRRSRAARAGPARARRRGRCPTRARRRRLWERLLQGPFRHAVLERRRGRGRAHPRRRAEGRRCAGQGPRGPDRLRPRRSRPAHPEGPAAPAGGRRAGGRPAGEPEDPRLRPPRRRAHLRRQDAARAGHVAGRDQPHPGARGAGRQGGGPAQGRRPLHLRPRRRGDGRAAGGRHRRRGGAGRHRRACLRRPHRPARDAARARAPVLRRHRHHRRGRARSRLAALAAHGAAFAVYMGVGNAPLLRRNLLAAGADPATPVVHRRERHAADRARHRHHAARPDRLPSPQLAIAGPAVIFVGLDWQDAGLQRPEAVTVYRRVRAVSRPVVAAACCRGTP